jgi:hypothetical protein
LAYLGLLEAAAVVVQKAKVLVVEAMAPQVPAALLQRLQQQIQVAGVEAGPAPSHLTPVAQVALAFAAFGGLNKDNNNELCTY